MNIDVQDMSLNEIKSFLASMTTSSRNLILKYLPKIVPDSEYTEEAVTQVIRDFAEAILVEYQRGLYDGAKDATEVLSELEEVYCPPVLH